ncbi:MAG: hypothetical protein SFX18_13515 [Pirellulales bacterium]|nr:hypothetical protein [Pirellulales bacterium]
MPALMNSRMVYLLAGGALMSVALTAALAQQFPNALNPTGETTSAGAGAPPGATTGGAGSPILPEVGGPGIPGGVTGVGPSPVTGPGGSPDAGPGGPGHRTSDIVTGWDTVVIGTVESGSADQPQISLDKLHSLDEIRKLKHVGRIPLMVYRTEVINKSSSGPIHYIKSLQQPPDQRGALMQKIQELKGQLHSPEIKREQVEQDLRKALEQYFVADMQYRVRELDEVKKKVQELEAKLEKRLQSSQEAVDLQYKVILREADGMGFFGGGGSPLPGTGPLGDVISSTPNAAPPAGIPLVPPPTIPGPLPRLSAPIPVHPSGADSSGGGGFSGSEEGYDLPAGAPSSAAFRRVEVLPLDPTVPAPGEEEGPTR